MLNYNQLLATGNWKLATVLSHSIRNMLYDLRSTKVYVRKNKLFLQNEPKSRKVKFNVNNVLTKDYDQMDTWSIRKNEPKTNPNEPKTNPNLAQKTTQRTQTNPKQTQYKPKQTQFQSQRSEFSLLANKVNFQAQKIDGPVQISKISENVCFAHKGLCFIGRYRP
jgi:hypothetical protein